MKRLLTLLTIACTALNLQAQVGKNPTKNDADAKRILDGVSARFKTYRSPQASFTYRVENAQGKTLSSKNGTVVMKGAKYKVVMDGLEIYSDGKTSWNYDKGANEVTVNSVSASGSAMTPQKLFTNFYDRDFYYKFNGEKKVDGKTVQEIELTPTDKTRPFYKVYVYVDKATGTIQSARFLEKTGGRYSYTITAIKPNASVSDNEFSFDKARHPGVEVVDLR